MQDLPVKRWVAAGAAALGALALNVLPAGTAPMSPSACSSSPPSTTAPTRGCSWEHRRDGRGAQPNPGNRDHHKNPQTPGPDKPGNGPKDRPDRP